MKAIELTETGGPEVMHLREIPTPIPQESEVLIRVAVTGVNFIDLYVREGGGLDAAVTSPGRDDDKVCTDLVAWRCGETQ
jgi:NADPH:quinone reductase-like Zn-dependent oxidoreductase